MHIPILITQFLKFISFISVDFLYGVLVGGVQLTNIQWIYLILNISLIFVIGIGLSIWKIFQSRYED